MGEESPDFKSDLLKTGKGERLSETLCAGKWVRKSSIGRTLA